MQMKESIDLMNVEYEDVLHLYRGWRKSESALKDKDKELAVLKNRVNQLQDSHNKFRGQIQALESVKELTVSLQSQVTALSQENKQLMEENKELANLNIRAEEIIKEKEDAERQQARMLKNVQLEVATLTGRYEETLKAQKELERIAHSERTSRMALESRLSGTDHSMQEISEENKSLRHQLEVAQLKLNQCDQELLHASEQLASITKEIVNISSTKEALANAEAEISILKGDIARVLRLFEAMPGSRDFLQHWADSSDMSFVGMEHAADYEESEGYHSSRGGVVGGFSESMAGSKKMTETEFAHIKRVHGKDPFPLTGTLAEEAEYWVPSEAARLGLQFMNARFPNASTSVIMDFLRSMNKVWLRRERRKVRRVREVLGGELDDLRRQLSQQKPYRGVLAERQIRRLQSQVKSDRRRQLAGRPRSRLEAAVLDVDSPRERRAGRTHFAVEDVAGDDLAGGRRGPGRRPCQADQWRRALERQDTEAAHVASARLLQASLCSLDAAHLRSSQAALREEANPLVRVAWESTEDGEEGGYPSASYLRGALWLGRNLTLVSEELGQAMDQLRLRTLADLQQIEHAHDGASSSSSTSTDGVAELRRSLHRLKILATGTATAACTMAGKSKTLARHILQGASELEPGNAKQFERFLASLPIESALLLRPPGSAAGLAGGGSGGSPSSRTLRSTSPANRSVSMRMSALLDTPLYTADLNKSREGTL